METDGRLAPERRDDFLERVTQLAEDPSVHIEVLDRDTAVLRPGDGKRRILLVRYEPEGEADLFARLGKIMRSTGPLRLEVLLVGGPEGVRKLLKRARPLFTTSRQYLYHQADDGSLWSDAQGPSFAMLSKPPPPLDEGKLASLRDKALRGRELISAERAELSTFIGRQSAAKPVLTWTVLGIIGVVFAMEYAFGGVEAAPTLVHMGAFYPPKVRQGELWRFASCTFLHAGVVHALMNGYVLYALGSFLEKIIGRWRFALLYAAAAFAGSIASYLRLEEGFSVGASGALWGCLGAHAVLAFRPGGLLPQAMIAGARNAALINLGLNVMISFRPRVDWAAHAGGGLIGALLMHFVLRHGLPPLGEEGAAVGPPVDRRPRAIAPIAVVMCGLLLSGLLIALVTGRPWELTRPPKLEARAIPELGAAVEVPKLLAHAGTKQHDQGVVEVVFGELPLDPAIVAVQRAPLVSTGEELSAIRQQLRDTMRSELAAQATAIEEPRDDTLAGRPAVRARYRFASGVEIDDIALIFDGAIFRVQAARMPGYDAWNDISLRVASSVRPQ